MASRSSAAEGGFTYIALLISVSIISIGLLAVSEVWVKVAEQQRMEQLKWAGNQYVAAIESYYNSPVGSLRIYPSDFEDLLKDGRYLGVRRHLRERYANPFTGLQDWEPIASPSGGMQGVRAIAGQEQASLIFVYNPVESYSANPRITHPER